MKPYEANTSSPANSSLLTPYVRSSLINLHAAGGSSPYPSRRQPPEMQRRSGSSSSNSNSSSSSTRRKRRKPTPDKKTKKTSSELMKCISASLGRVADRRTNTIGCSWRFSSLAPLQLSLCVLLLLLLQSCCWLCVCICCREETAGAAAAGLPQQQAMYAMEMFRPVSPFAVTWYFVSPQDAAPTASSSSSSSKSFKASKVQGILSYRSPMGVLSVCPEPTGTAKAGKKVFQQVRGNPHNKPLKHRAINAQLTGKRQWA